MSIRGGGAGKNILIVEDEMMIALMLEDMLQELGYTVAAMAAQPKDALTAIDSHKIDCAVLDVNLGDCDSSEIAAVLEARKIPFVFSTGYGKQKIDSLIERHPVITKPFSIEDLEQTLAAILSGDSKAP